MGQQFTSWSRPGSQRHRSETRANAVLVKVWRWNNALYLKVHLAQVTYCSYTPLGGHREAHTIIIIRPMTRVQSLLLYGTASTP